ncbi:hypothetical protein K1719_009732 [Acacia pycnantha]|nr:hypothetical protein K1719_009732 [Acacia pycnantha]
MAGGGFTDAGGKRANLYQHKITVYTPSFLASSVLSNLTDKRRNGPEDISWACLFGLTCWKLWTARNLFLFEKKQTSPANLSREVVMYAGFNAQVVKHFSMGTGSSRGKQERMVYWVRPPSTHVVLNCDVYTDAGGKRANLYQHKITVYTPSFLASSVLSVALCSAMILDFPVV